MRFVPLAAFSFAYLAAATGLVVGNPIQRDIAGRATRTTTTASACPTSPVLAQPWGQCGGIGYTGPTTCAQGIACAYSNPYFSTCLPTAPLAIIPLHSQCGGADYTGSTVCVCGASCVVINAAVSTCQLTKD